MIGIRKHPRNLNRVTLVFYLKKKKNQKHLVEQKETVGHVSDFGISTFFFSFIFSLLLVGTITTFTTFTF